MSEKEEEIEIYNKLLLMAPEKRVRESSGDVLYDKIAGILILYSMYFEIREKHIDIITIRDAVSEIKDLISEYSD